MKKLFFSTLLAIVITSASFAANIRENTRVSNMFKSEYANASNITYTQMKDHITVNFTWNEQRMQAFYDLDGNKIATSRAIALNSLPISTQQNLQQKFNGYTATEIIEFDNVQEGEGISYYVSLVKDSKKIVVKIGTEGFISIFKK